MFDKFKKNRRGYFSFLFLSFLFFSTIFAEIIANDKPIFISFNGEYFFPIFQKISEKKLGGVFESEADYRDLEVQKLILKNNKNFLIWPPIRFSHDTINYDLEKASPAKPNKQNILGTDDQGRDVLARVIYGIRISLIFGILLSFFTLILAVFFGAVQGFFGGVFDVLFQRFSEIWSAMPVLFLLIILSAIIEPGFFVLLFLMLLFGWISLASSVRAEFLRLKNFEFVLAAKVLGASNFRLIFCHILPNAAPVIISNLPFLISGSIITLASLDFLGLGLPVGSPSLGELLAQGKNNVNAYHLAITALAVISAILTSLIFVGEALRNTFDARRS